MEVMVQLLYLQIQLLLEICITLTLQSILELYLTQLGMQFMFYEHWTLSELQRLQGTEIMELMRQILQGKHDEPH